MTSQLTVLLLILGLVSVAGCAEPPERVLPQSSLTAVEPMDPASDSIDLGRCSIQQLSMNVDRPAVAAMLPTWAKPIGFADPALDIVNVVLLECNHVNSTAGWSAPAKLVWSAVPLYYDRDLTGDEFGADYLLEMFVETPEPRLLATLAAHGVPILPATIATSPESATIRTATTDYEIEFYGTLAPTELIGTWAAVDDRRMVYGSNSRTWLDVNGEDDGSSGFVSTAIVAASKGTLAVLTQAGMGGKLVAQTLEGPAFEVLDPGAMQVVVEHPRLDWNGTVLRLENCEGWNQFYEVEPMQVNALLPEGFTAGTFMHGFFAATPVVPQAARLQVFGMTCDGHTPTSSFVQEALGWTSVLLATANDNGTSGMGSINSFGFEWFASPELGPVLSSVGLNVTIADVVTSPNGLRIAAHGDSKYISTCTTGVPMGFGLHFELERRFFGSPAGGVGSLDLNGFHNYEDGRIGHALLAEGTLADWLEPTGAGQCQWMTADNGFEF